MNNKNRLRKINEESCKDNPLGNHPARAISFLRLFMSYIQSFRYFFLRTGSFVEILCRIEAAEGGLTADRIFLGGYELRGPHLYFYRTAMVP